MICRCYALCLLAAVTLLCSQSSFAQSPHSAIEFVQPRMVKIFGAGGLRGLHGYGTGFLISPTGHIATVWSHVLDADSVTAILGDGRKFEAHIVGAEPALDLAVLKIAGEDLPYFDLDEAVSAGPGTWVLAFNNMFKVATGDEPLSVLQGVIAAETRLDARRGAFEIPYKGPVLIVDSVTNNPGTAGGVLTTRDGRLLAMLGKELRNAQTNTWINYAVPISELKGVIDQIITGNFQRQATGSQHEQNPNRYGPLDFGIILIPDVLNRTPAYVDAVRADSPAVKAGLRPDDLVLFVGGQLVSSCKELRTELGRLEEGDTLELVVRRGTALVSFELIVPSNKP